MVVAGLFELAGIGSVVPFLAVAGDPSLVQKQGILRWIYGTLRFQDPLAFIVALGVAVIVFLVVSNLIKAAVLSVTVQFGKDRMSRWSSALYRHILGQPYHHFLHRSSADMIKTLWDDLPTTVTGVLVPWLNIAARVVVVVGAIVLVLVADPLMALVLVGVLGLSYSLIFVLIRKPLSERGVESGRLSRSRYRRAMNSFGGIKDVKFLGLEDQLIETYRAETVRQYDNDGFRDSLAVYPRYLLETVAFGGVVAVVLVYLTAGQSLVQVLPLLGLYAFAGYRLMPYLQQILTDLAKIRYSAPRVHLLAAAFVEGDPVAPGPLSDPVRTTTVLQSYVEVKGLRFQYPKADRWVLDGVDLRIEARSTVGLVGPSGAGKSTLVDLFLGLLPLDKGTLEVDGQPVSPTNRGAWKGLWGYVPQQIFLVDGTVAENIAFGVPEAEIDHDRVRRAAERANVHRFIAEDLELGYQTKVGERGVRLSGGQRQRIGIARALYREPQILVLDEATSSLDGVAEAEVMDAIRALGGLLTLVIVAHRLTTLRACDRIFVLDGGRVADSGTYDSLMAGNDLFRAMSRSFE
jgi:ABC-type multidrug transport system fused ATPase/permease subunit